MGLLEKLSWMRERKWIGYAVAAAGVLAGLLVRLACGRLLAGASFVTFFPAVMLAALAGGRAAGAVAAVFSAFCAYYLAVPLLGVPFPQPGTLAMIAVFLMVCTGIIMVIDQIFVTSAELAKVSVKLRRSNERLEERVAARTVDRDRLWELSRDLMLVMRFDGILTAVNPAWTAVLGWTMREMVGGNIFNFMHPEDVAATRRRAALLAQGRSLPPVLNRFKHKNEQYRWISWSTVAGDGLITAVGRDVTEEHAREQVIEISEARLRSVFETNTRYQGLMTTDGELLDANQTSLTGIQARLEDVVGGKFWNSPWFTATPGMPEMIQQAVRLVAEGQSFRLEMKLNLPDGQHVFDFSMRPVRAANGDVINIVPEAADITEYRAAEEKLRQSQKMEAVGQLTGGLAHDFNNLLTGISGSIELMETRIAQGRMGDLQRYLNTAKGAAKRAAALTHRLLAFSRRQTLDPKPTDLDRLTADLTELVCRTVGPAIEVKVIAAAGLWSIFADQNQLENALLNLCINARDAMPDGGRLTIETANKWLDERAAREQDLPMGQYVSLCVSDTGTGMTPEVIARAFDPFFTTKPLGMGTGLGLSMVYGFARQSGGQVRIYSEAGSGTMVCVYLPRYFKGHEMDDETPEAVILPRTASGETVLVVDDEPSVRALIIEVLDELGYGMIEAEDGRVGLKILESTHRIDLLITDVGLPGGMNGRQLADAGTVLRPGLKTLFITGYAENAVIGDGHLRHGMQILTKPFGMDDLARKIKTMLVEA